MVFKKMFIDGLLFQVSHLPLDFCHLVATYEELISLAGVTIYYVSHYALLRHVPLECRVDIDTCAACLVCGH